jgi:hypothetical protein
MQMAKFVMQWIYLKLILPNSYLCSPRDHWSTENFPRQRGTEGVNEANSVNEKKPIVNIGVILGYSVGFRNLLQRLPCLSKICPYLADDIQYLIVGHDLKMPFRERIVETRSYPASLIWSRI